MDTARDFDNGSRSRSNSRERSRERERSRRGDRPSRFSGGGSGGGNDRDRSPRGKKGMDRRVFISNIPYEFRLQELKTVFQTEVGDVNFIEMFKDANDQPRGCGIVEFDTAELAKLAINKMNKHELMGRKIVVKEDEVERDKTGRPVKGGGGGGNRSSLGGGMRNNNLGGGGGMGMRGGRMGGSHWLDAPNNQGGNAGGGAGGGGIKWGNTYGLSPQFLESLWIDGPLINKVFVANLDYTVDEKKLKEVFRLAGKVTKMTLSRDKDGKSRGFAVVYYDHPVEAVQAISMFHNQTLFDRRMTVRMDRVSEKDEPPNKLPEGLMSIGMGLGANGAPLSDVSRNLPSLAPTNTVQNVLPAAVAQPSLAALTGVNLNTADRFIDRRSLELVPGLGGSGGLGLLGAGSDSLNSAALVHNPFGVNTASALNSNAAFLTANSQLAANSLFQSQADNSRFLNANSLGGRDFDSLSAALSGGGGAAFGNSLVGGGGDRGGSGGGGGDFRGSGGVGGGRSGNMGGGGGGGGSGGLSSNLNNSSANSNQSSRLSDTIMIKNLPPTVTWQQLREKCREVGDVKFAEMRGKDIGLVQFSSQWDAQRAVNLLDRARLDGRTLDVRFY